MLVGKEPETHRNSDVQTAHVPEALQYSSMSMSAGETLGLFEVVGRSSVASRWSPQARKTFPIH